MHSYLLFSPIQARSNGKKTEVLIEAHEPIQYHHFSDLLGKFLKEIGIGQEMDDYPISWIRCCATYVVKNLKSRDPQDGIEIGYEPIRKSTNFTKLWNYYGLCHTQLERKLRASISNDYPRLLRECQKLTSESTSKIYTRTCVCLQDNCQGSINFLSNSLCPNQL